MTRCAIVCNRCSLARAWNTPSHACPGYRCDGTLELSDRDEDNYDVVQYTRYEFVPLKAREHSAQVPKDARLKAERGFKKIGGDVNCLVATPTLELGVDIGQLEMVVMRNVPPTPANYAQRSGRAGRRHRIGAVFSYCRNNQHDQYFYADPPAMIAGEVRIPAFSTRNAPMVRKHVHSAVLTALRALDDPDKEEVLKETFPPFIWAYFGEKEEGIQRLTLAQPDFSGLGELLGRHESAILASLTTAFTDQWPEEDRQVVEREQLLGFLREMPGELERVVGALVAEIRAYDRILDEYRARQGRGEMLSAEDRRRRNNYEAGLRHKWSESQENYSLTHLARSGFFPGYALVKDNVKAQSLDPVLDVSRPLAIALRELTPANREYANGNQFKVRRMDFYKLKAADVNFDVVLEGLGRISDQDAYPYRVGFTTFASQMGEHGGGHAGTVGTVPYTYLNNARLRLVNLGPVRKGPASSQRGSDQLHIGFPICSVCGETRSPFASVAEITNFAEHHEQRCGRQVGWHALHVDIYSDTLIFGPFSEEHDAVNAMEALRIGISQVLEAGETELEVVLLKNADGRDLAALYDPTPGGSGFLPLVMQHWRDVHTAARGALEACHCAKACYKCLLHFRNQQHHTVLDKHRALNALGECWGDFEKDHVVPPVYGGTGGAQGKQDSDKEESLLKILGDKSFPLPPEAQYPLDLGGGTRTLADFAYPEEKVLIYVDGLSEAFHGNPAQQRKDRIIRIKAQAEGWKVCEVSAEGLKDQTMVADFLEMLAIYLGVE